MHRRFVLVAILLVVSACEAGPIPTPPAGPGSPTPPSAAPRTLPPTESPTDPPTAPPSMGDGPARPDPETFLQVCPGRTASGRSSDLACDEVVATALADPSVAGLEVTRVDVRAGCGGDAPCPPPGKDAMTATVLSGDTATEIEIGVGADGGLAVTAVREGRPPVRPSFAPPPAGRATLPDAPASLADRAAYPLCGEEAAPMGGPYDVAGRRCFLDGVLAGSPVEFVTALGATEGGSVHFLYRFGGSGGIEYVTGSGGDWTRSFTGIEPAGGDLVFDVDGLATAPEPVP